MRPDRPWAAEESFLEDERASTPSCMEAKLTSSLATFCLMSSVMTLRTCLAWVSSMAGGSVQPVADVDEEVANSSWFVLLELEVKERGSSPGRGLLACPDAMRHWWFRHETRILRMKSCE